MRIEIDQDLCCSAGACVLEAPDVFDQDDEDGTVVLLDATPDEGQRDAVEQARVRCPVRAIAVHEN
ncbi:ferredoxin [Streptomyces sp. NPDC003077]|uniref:ferredoxin n=1 Tax=Streptomyces sp. NPDC003077 TaxID=3154443 RepID=UPI0033A7302C